MALAHTILKHEVAIVIVIVIVIIGHDSCFSVISFFIHLYLFLCKVFMIF
jgi:hypothetical protein